MYLEAGNMYGAWWLQNHSHLLEELTMLPKSWIWGATSRRGKEKGKGWNGREKMPPPQNKFPVTASERLDQQVCEHVCVYVCRCSPESAADERVYEESED